MLFGSYIHSVLKGAVVSLEQTLYSVTEGDEDVEVCVIVSSPNNDCPIDFPFNIDFSTSDDSAGKYTLCLVTYCF